MKPLLKHLTKNIIQQKPIHILISVYFFIAFLGFCALCLPFSQKAPTKAIDHLFIAASAASTTGLTTVSVPDNYNFFGQLVILLLIQIGGLHYMSFGSIIMLTRQKKLSKFQEELVKTDFGLPDDFNIYAFSRSVIVFSLLVESIGAAFLYFIFRSHGVEHPFWNAIFHSISAFCTAGFSLFNNSFEGFVHDPLLNIVIFVLSLLGAVGFIVVTDYWEMMTGKKKAVTFTTKIIMYFSFIVIIVGTLLLLVTKSFSGEMPFMEKAWTSLFQAMTASTTVGFNTAPIHTMSHGALYLLVILMIIGASPAGTGGGIKSTTIVAVLAQTISTFRGKVNVTLMGFQIPNYRLRLASASFTFYIFILILGIYLLNLSDNFPIFETIFEATSAQGNVGLSMGITSSLSFFGKIIIVGIMMLGRVGPLIIGLALFYDKDRIDDLGWYEDVAL